MQTFLSRPDLTPLAVTVDTPASATAPGHVFVAPFKGPGTYGPLILDNRGEPIWFKPIDSPTAMNFRVQHYRGQDVLTWWEGKVDRGYGGGTGLVFDRAYQQVARVKAGNGYHSDLHEFIVTSRGSALVAIYLDRRIDASAIGGPVDGHVVEGVVQEIDIASRRVLFEWHSLDHVGLDESLLPYGDATGGFDYFHLNSI
ncbi:MAG TPA: arylsulfotransferase family protein, partial [Candidatus Limnocylindrales bacterium]|nr:arylsulfotransferase family protein [Candidatus Limnocylindrales bacterium]